MEVWVQQVFNNINLKEGETLLFFNLINNNMPILAEPKEKLSKETIIDQAEKYSNENGAIAFARGVRWAVKLIMPYVQDYHRGKISGLIK
jgi:hypothetical protein